MFRATRSLWAFVAFLAVFAVLIWLVSDRFLIPAIEAAKGATPDQKRRLMAFSRLLLALVLMILSIGLIMIFRVKRFFLPRGDGVVRQKTEYVDAWAEAGRRAEAPPPSVDE